MNESRKEIIEISVDDIIPNRFQPRLTFDMEALNELANSIREHGIIQPLVVRRLQDKYEIIAGERRFKAACLIGMSKVPCIVMDLNDNESAEVAVIENIQRKEMTPLEEAKSFKKILDKGYLTQDELARRMGKSQSSVANKLRLLNLDDVVQDAILNGKISERHARSLLKVESKEEQRNLLTKVIEQRLTVRQLDDLIKEKLGVNNMDSGFNNNVENNVSSNSNTIEINDIFKTPKKDEPKKEPDPIYPSMPNVTIPTGIESNPQMNLINDVNKPDYINKKDDELLFEEVKNNNEDIKPVNINDLINPAVFSNNNVNQTTFENRPNDIFKSNEPIINNNYSNNNVNINNSINNDNDVITNRQNEINSVINPSVITQTNEVIDNSQNLNNNNNNDNNSNINNGFFDININDIKNNAQDILPKKEERADLSSLMSSEKQENKFFVDLNVKEEDLTTNSLPFKIQSAVDSLNRKIDEIKFQGTKITKEEKDLGNTYEIVIKIEK